MRNLINLHIHTTASDGEFTPQEILEKIKATNIKTFAITDHDTIKGCWELDKKSLGDLEFINGCEFSVKPFYQIPKARLHILGYDLDLTNVELQKFLKNKKTWDIANLELQFHNLEKVYNLHFAKAEKELIYQKNKCNRVDIARLLLKHNYVKTIDEAFDNYLTNNYEQVRSQFKVYQVDDVIEIIKKANGLISIAHIITNRMDEQQLDNFLQYLKSREVDALELYHPIHSLAYQRFLLEKIEKYQFLISGGTDYHGPLVKPGYELETSKNNQQKIRHLSLVDAVRNRKLNENK